MNIEPRYTVYLFCVIRVFPVVPVAFVHNMVDKLSRI